MADNVTLNSGSGGETLATDDIGGVQHQRVKIQYGADGSATDVSDSNPLPIDDAGGSITVDGTITANLSATDNGVLDNIDTNTTGLAGCVAGSELQVDIVSGNVTNAGTFAVQVDGDALTALQTLDNSVFADDAAFTLASSSVNMAGAIRDDSLSTLTAVEGDAVPLRVNSTGALHVTGGGGGTEYSEDAATPATITGTATMMERDDALSTLTPAEGDWAAMRCDSEGALWVNVKNADGTATDDAAFTPGTGTGVPIFAAFDDTTPDSVDEGDAGVLRMSANRNLYGTIRDAAGNERGANVNASNQLEVACNGTVTANLGATDNAVLDNIQTAVELCDNTVVAHDAAVSGSTGVSMVGFNARSSEPTAVASADATQGLATLLGKQVTVPYAIPASTWSYASPAAVTDTSDDAAKAAAGAGIRNYITGVQVFNGHDTVGTEVVIKDGSTVLWRGWAEQTGGGCSARFDPPLRGTANTAVNVANITTGSSTYFNLQGYEAAE